MTKKAYGFTIVELLIVIVVIAILAAISIVAYTGIQTRARDTTRQSDISQVQKLVEAYYAIHGLYPTTASSMGNAGSVRTDSNCQSGTQSVDWVPGLDTTLPQSIPNTNKGVNGSSTGCYIYVSDGTKYIISAWNNIESGPQTSTMYRRVGVREMSWFGSNFYICNHSGIIGGISGGVYSATRDYYKYSYTLTNITACNETPPAGA